MKTKLLSICAVTLLLAGSCTQRTSLVDKAVRLKNREIKVTAGLEPIIHTKSLSGAIEGTTFPSNVEDVFNVMAIKKDALDREQTMFAPTSINSGDNSEFTFSEARHYPSEATSRLNFYAYAPSGPTTFDLENSRITFTIINGFQDIIWAKDEGEYFLAGDGETQQHPNFTFVHKLMKVTFAVKRTPDFLSTQLTNITLKGIKTNPTLDLKTGEITWGETATNLIITNGRTTINTTVTDLVNRTYSIQAVDQLIVSVTAGGVTYPDQTVQLPTLAEGESREGKAHRIVLTFMPKKISMTSGLTEWEDGGDANHNIQ